MRERTRRERFQPRDRNLRKRTIYLARQLRRNPFAGDVLPKRRAQTVNAAGILQRIQRFPTRVRQSALAQIHGQTVFRRLHRRNAHGLHLFILRYAAARLNAREDRLRFLHQRARRYRRAVLRAHRIRDAQVAPRHCQRIFQIHAVGSRARQRAGAQGHGVGLVIGVLKARYIAHEHLRVGHQVKRQRDGLRLLQVRVAGHDGVQVLLGEGAEQRKQR